MKQWYVEESVQMGRQTDRQTETYGTRNHTYHCSDSLQNGNLSTSFQIGRVRNKWRFSLKDGIMNLSGKDYVFHKATGEAEW
jgi:hypothetical protein